jgi:NADH:ubiquinone oxidoreductase subunit 6 (subunit J)
MRPYLIFTLTAALGSMGAMAGHERRGSALWPGRSAMLGLVAAAVVKAGDSIGTITAGTPAQAPGIDVATLDNNDSNIQQLAQNLYTDHLLAFELTSVLLIVAVAGTVLLTRKWPKASETDAA